MSTQQKERFHFLDGLRGIASTMIVFHHAFSSNIDKFLSAHHFALLGSFLRNFTQSGVELFFVLSGVVLLRPYLRGERKFEIGIYLYRRAKRIYPPYWVALVFGSLVILVNMYYPTWFSKILMQFSWETALRQVPIIGLRAFYYNLAWWSLQIELLFYLFVPFIIWSFPKREKLTNTWLYGMVAFNVLIAVSAQLLFTKYYPDGYTIHHYVANIFNVISYPVCFFMGTYLAAKDSDTQTARNLLMMGGVIILASLFYPPIVSSGYGLVYGGFIMLTFKSDVIKRALSHPLMIWLGERSYSLFLIHFSVFYLSNYIVSHFTPDRNIYYMIFSRAVGIPVALFLAMLLFHFVERRQARGLLTEKAFWPWQAKRVLAEQGLH